MKTHHFQNGGWPLTTSIIRLFVLSDPNDNEAGSAETPEQYADAILTRGPAARVART